jgi:kumamolisin
MASSEHLDLAITLPVRNEAGLDSFLEQLYDPESPAYGRYLSSGEFAAMFGATQADYAAVADWAASQGLTVTATYDNRLLLDVNGTVANVQRAFNVRLERYQARTGRAYYAPMTEPSVPTSMVGKISGIVGLDDAGFWQKHCIRNPHPAGKGDLASVTGLTPKSIATAYNINGATGSGQTLGLFELDGYQPSDIATYVKTFGIKAVPLQNVLVDKVRGGAGSGADEVTLDIELQNAIAPGAKKLYVYEGPNSNRGVIDTYTRIATDNLATSISTSWGEAEDASGASVLKAEQTAFKQMASQGQSIYAAAGDAGAYDNGSTLSVDDPGSQPYMCSVGGTTLKLSSNGAYISESTWNGDGTLYGGAGGGGISIEWAIPSWQSGVVSKASLGSTSMRNVPDVALDADPNTGYAIYVFGSWNEYGGTSCAAPLWAGFTALSNQQRAAKSKTNVGFSCPMLYKIATGKNYSKDFHDIADNSNNLYYPAVKSYDLATGWGSFNGANLLADMLAQP